MKIAREEFNYKLCQDVVKERQYRNVELVKAALWSSTCQVDFAGEVGGAACVSKQGDHKVEAVAIDDLLSKEGQIEKLFIKMDVEGAELEALMGAKNTI